MLLVLSQIVKQLPCAGTLVRRSRHISTEDKHYFRTHIYTPIRLNGAKLELAKELAEVLMVASGQASAQMQKMA